ncbi:MAG: hemolysin secretion protein D [Rhodospirillaceae bacterium]|jgi:adhesin transport system membrane fusion protein|uniref:HlyD family type I secretion periplasmic adaptor subunit n=1 Tax=unclassified Hwanghaeella TaxID=2605944 RepID=UPI000C560DC7|nr:hemolysin secretion protein D [Rhodospirillales bacterium]MAX47437.1 hemolysin secretion protein D [Rhodospirillaceae bacterium]|tara:strand:+ start:875 stop:2191 length:1317 start_codon:yes stop_codon:yes gene_type:complete
MSAGNWGDEIYDAESNSGVGRSARLWAHVLLFLIAAFFVVFLVWAHSADLDEITRGEGKIIPSGQTKIVQHFEGGIVSEITVREGDIVDAGQVIMRIENRLADAELAEKTTKYRSLLAEGARLQAEATGANEINFSQDILTNAPDRANDQRDVFDTNLKELQGKIRIRETQRTQALQELRQKTAQVSQIQSQLELARQELNLVQPLVASGAASQQELLTLRRSVVELESQLEDTKLSIPRIRSQIQESTSTIEQELSAFRAKAQQDLSKVRTEAERLREDLTAGQDREKRTDIRSPVRGTVNKILINTIGGVVKPGDPVAEIVPLEDSLLVEARIRPADRAQLYPGLSAVVKVSAYDFSIHGGLDAQLVDISPDTILDEDGKPYYRVRLSTTDTSLGKDMPIIPGMTATVDIITGHKTVLQYLLKPIEKGINNSMTER